mgnify:CR=1 FL=1
MGDVINTKFNTQYNELENMRRDIIKVIYQYTDAVPVAGVLGVLRVVEHQLLEEQTCPR